MNQKQNGVEGKILNGKQTKEGLAEWARGEIE